MNDARRAELRAWFEQAVPTRLPARLLYQT